METTQNVFQRAYEAEQRLLALNPEHPLAQYKIMHSVEKYGYEARIFEPFLTRYNSIAGTENQLARFISDIETVIVEHTKKN